MGADLSRVRSHALRDYAGVVLQQGRLLLDSDFNESVSIVDRRLRASIADLDSPGPANGIAGVAVVPRTTPDGFKVTAAGGKLSIGRGRIYVDGLLAENHGTGPAEFDPMLAEIRPSADTPYGKQPYAPGLVEPTGGTFLAYLDVWPREVTNVEAPDLVEVAVGVDTTARTQTAWAVRLHEVAAVSCSTPDKDVPGWLDVIAPSPSRATVRGQAATATSDPCELPPAGGYRGRENQTYRIEIHDPGPAGTATFTWSRDNASVVSPVLDVLAGGTELRPASLGRDTVLGFDLGQWVEVLDDHREWSGAPGDIRRIDDVVDGTLVLSAAVAVDLRLTPTQATARHLRVRRWDQSGVVRSSTGTVLTDLTASGASGVIPVPTAASTRVVLEAGITVSLTAGGGDFRTGDHWIVAARVADNSVEEITSAPPLGVHHHYARLGVVTFPDTATDCRTLWPATCTCQGEGGCSDCTVCVTPESHASGALTIQAAIDQVVPTGGTVCLAVGMYPLDAPGVVIEGASSVTLRGQGPRTVLVARARGIRVARSAFVSVENLAVLGSGIAPAIELESTAACTVQDTAVLMGAAAVNVPSPAIALSGVNLRTRLLGNVVLAPTGIGTPAGDKQALLTGDLLVADNLIACRDVGIGLQGRVAHVLGNRVESNTILGAGVSGVRLLGAIGRGHGFAVTGNTLMVGGSGILVGPSGFDVVDNDVSSPVMERDGSLAAVGVVVSTFGELRGPTRVSGNTLRAGRGAGIAVLAPVESLEVRGNRVTGSMDGIVMDERAAAEVAVVADNTLTDVGSREDDKAAGVVGIQVTGAASARVSGNVVHRVGAGRGLGDQTAGVRVLACPQVSVTGNDVDHVGVAEQARGELGIAVLTRPERVAISGNTSRRVPDDRQEPAGRWIAILLGAPARDERFTRAGLYVLAADRLAISSFAAWVPTGPATAAVLDGNIADGGASLEPAILAVVRGDAVVTGNHARKMLDRDGEAALSVQAVSATVGNNRAAGGLPFAASLNVQPERLAAVGNLVSSEVIGVPPSPSGILEDPWRPLNVYNV